jgi:hypothetical protein
MIPGLGRCPAGDGGGPSGDVADVVIEQGGRVPGDGTVAGTVREDGQAVVAAVAAVTRQPAKALGWSRPGS